MDPFKTLLLDTPTVISGDGTGFLQSSNNLGDVDDAAASRTNLDVYSKAEVNTNNFIKQDSGFAISDGSTTDRAERAQYGAVGDVAGLPVTFVSEFVVPTSNPSASIRICDVTSGVTPPYGNSATCFLFTDGELRVASYGTLVTDQRRLGYANFRADYSGQSVRISIAFPNGDSTTSPTIYINGEDKTSSFSLTTIGTPPNWMDADIATTWFLSGHNWPAGRTPYSCLIIGALSATEAANYTAGMPLEQAAPWTRHPGTVVSRLTGIWSDGASAPDTLTWTGTAIDSCIDDGSATAQAVSDSTFSLVQGRVYVVSIPGATLNSGSWPELKTGSDTSLTTAGGLQVLSYAGERTVQFTANATGDFRIGWRITAATNFSHGEMTISDAGPLDRPIYQPALATDDTLGRFSRRLVGMTSVSSKSDFRIIGNTATSGNEQVLSGAVLEDADAVVDSVEFDTDGTPTITLGSASGGAQYVASTALSAGLNADETLVTRKAASTALWVGSDSTANVRTYVSGHKVTGV